MGTSSPNGTRTARPKRFLLGAATLVSFFNAWIAFVSNGDKYHGYEPDYVASLRRLAPLNLFQIASGAAGYKTYCPPGQFTRLFVGGFAILGFFLCRRLLRQERTRESLSKTGPSIDGTQEVPLPNELNLFPPTEAMTPVGHVSGVRDSGPLGHDLDNSVSNAKMSEMVSFEDFSAEFLELVNSCDVLTATREALLRSFACALADDRQRSVLWLDFTYACYDKMIEIAIDSGNIELMANLSMWHGIVRSLLRKQDVAQPFAQAFAFSEGLDDPVFVARCTEEYAWAFERTNMTTAFETQLAKAEEAFRACGRSDRADEIVRLRTGGESRRSSFLRQGLQSPEATSILGSADAQLLRNFLN